LIQIIASFSIFNISQGSVATHLMYVGISINNFIASFLLNVSVNECVTCFTQLANQSSVAGERKENVQQLTKPFTAFVTGRW